MTLQIIMTILIALNAIISGSSSTSYTGGSDLKAQIRELGKEVAPLYVEVGATEVEPVTDYIVFENLPPNALGATWFTHGSHSCEARSVALAVYWQYSNFAFYGSPLWKSIVSHEWSHVTQGPACDNPTSELEADLTGYTVLLEAGEEEAVAIGLQRDLIILAMATALDENKNRSLVLDQLDLSDKEREYYTHLPSKFIHTYASNYSRPLLRAILEDKDGIFQLNSSPPRTLDASIFREWVQELK